MTASTAVDPYHLSFVVFETLESHSIYYTVIVMCVCHERLVHLAKCLR